MVHNAVVAKVLEVVFTLSSLPGFKGLGFRVEGLRLGAWA